MERVQSGVEIRQRDGSSQAEASFERAEGGEEDEMQGRTTETVTTWAALD
jgi:hypothetical protein